MILDDKFHVFGTKEKMKTSEILEITANSFLIFDKILSNFKKGLKFEKLSHDF